MAGKIGEPATAGSVSREAVAAINNRSLNARLAEILGPSETATPLVHELTRRSDAFRDIIGSSSTLARNSLGWRYKGNPVLVVATDDSTPDRPTHAIAIGFNTQNGPKKPEGYTYSGFGYSGQGVPIELQLYPDGRGMRARVRYFPLGASVEEQAREITALLQATPPVPGGP